MRLVDFVSLFALFLFITLGQLIGKWPAPDGRLFWLIVFAVLIAGRWWAGERLR